MEYQLDPNWTSLRIKQLSRRLSLDRTKVYKWTWDRAKKEKALEKRVENKYFAKNEDDKQKPTLLALRFNEEMMARC